MMCTGVVVSGLLACVLRHFGLSTWWAVGAGVIVLGCAIWLVSDPTDE